MWDVSEGEDFSTWGQSDVLSPTSDAKTCLSLPISPRWHLAIRLHPVKAPWPSIWENTKSHQSSQVTAYCDFRYKKYLEQFYNSTCLFTLPRTLFLFTQSPSFETDILELWASILSGQMKSSVICNLPGQWLLSLRACLHSGPLILIHPRLSQLHGEGPAPPLKAGPLLAATSREVSAN